MDNKKSEDSSKTTPTKALNNIMEMFELQTTRLNIVEQQVLSLSTRVSGIEDLKFRNTR